MGNKKNDDSHLIQKYVQMIRFCLIENYIDFGETFWLMS